MRRERRWGERKGRSVSVTFFSRRLAERAGWQPQRGGWRRTGRRAGRSGDGPLAPKRRSRRGPGRAFQSRVAAAVEAESEFPQEPAQQAERPCPTWNQNGRTSPSLLDLITSPCILPKRELGCTFWVGAPAERGGETLADNFILLPLQDALLRGAGGGVFDHRDGLTVIQVVLLLDFTG